MEVCVLYCVVNCTNLYNFCMYFVLIKRQSLLCVFHLCSKFNMSICVVYNHTYSLIIFPNNTTIRKWKIYCSSLQRYIVSLLSLFTHVSLSWCQSTSNIRYRGHINSERLTSKPSKNNSRHRSHCRITLLCGFLDKEHLGWWYSNVAGEIFTS